MRRLLACVLLLAPARPDPPGASCDVTQAPFFARGDNATDDTAALQAALSADHCGTVVLSSPGLFLSTALDLSRAAASTLLIAAGAGLVLSPNRSGWAPGTALLWQSVNATLAGFTLGGGGAIYGGGRAWWPPRNQSNKHTHFRPHTLLLPNVSRLTVANLALWDSPGCTIQANGEDLVFENISISAAADECAQFEVAPNTGGFRLSGRRISVRHATVHNGDDCVPINPAPDGLTEDVWVQNVSCACGTNGAVVFNPGGGTVRNVTFVDMAVAHTYEGIGVKVATNSGPGSTPVQAVVEGVTFRNIAIQAPLNAAIYTDVFHQDVPTCGLPARMPPNTTGWLTVRNITVRDVVATVPDGQGAGCFVCAPGDAKCTGWAFHNVTVRRQDGQPAGPYTCIYFRNATTEASSPPLCGTG